jgi:hypothetical protein
MKNKFVLPVACVSFGIIIGALIWWLTASHYTIYSRDGYIIRANTSSGETWIDNHGAWFLIGDNKASPIFPSVFWWIAGSLAVLLFFVFLISRKRPSLAGATADYSLRFLKGVSGYTAFLLFIGCPTVALAVGYHYFFGNKVPGAAYQMLTPDATPMVLFNNQETATTARSFASANKLYLTGRDLIVDNYNHPTDKTWDQAMTDWRAAENQLQGLTQDDLNAIYPTLGDHVTKELDLGLAMMDVATLKHDSTGIENAAIILEKYDVWIDLNKSAIDDKVVIIAN